MAKNHSQTERQNTSNAGRAAVRPPTAAAAARPADGSAWKLVPAIGAGERPSHCDEHSLLALLAKLAARHIKTQRDDNTYTGDAS